MAKQEKSQPITKAIRYALGKYREENGNMTLADFAAKVKVSENTACFWEGKESQMIRKMHWPKVKTLIQPYIDEYDKLNQPAREAIMPTEIKSTSGSASEPVINVTLTAEELLMLKEFRQIPNGKWQRKALSLLGAWRELPEETREKIVSCTERGHTCEDSPKPTREPMPQPLQKAG